MGSDQTNSAKQNKWPNAFRTCIGPLVVSGLTLVAVLVTLDPADYRPGLPQGPGITLDESFNVQMGVYLVESLKSYGLGILDPGSLKEVFGNPAYNPDHPPLGRLWLGVFHEISRAIAPVESGDNPFVTIHARAGSAVAFALTVLLVGMHATCRRGALAGVASAACLAVMPRLFGHAHLASLETFMGLTWTVAILGTIQLWMRHADSNSEDDSISDSKTDLILEPPGNKASIFCGALIGLALLTKMQAILLFPLLAVWALWHWRLDAVRPLLVSSLSMSLVFLIGWPWLWSDLSGHLAEYFGRTTGRVSLNVWYLGQVFKDVGVPWHYPWVMTLVTVPIGILLLAVVELFQVRQRIFSDPTVSLIVGSIIAPLILFSLPGIAVYDGVRLFLVVFPGISLLAGCGASTLCDWLTARKRHHKAIIGILLGSQLAGIFMTTPYFLSYYNAVVGGTSGARHCGFEVSYWGDSFSREFLSDLVETVPDNTIVQVTPVLHQFQLAELERQVPILPGRNSETGKRVWLVAAEKPLAPFKKLNLSVGTVSSSTDTEYLAVFHRRADAPASESLEQAGWKLIISETCQGAVVASFWSRSRFAAFR